MYMKRRLKFHGEGKMSEEFNKSDDSDLLPHTALGVVIDSGDSLRDCYGRLRDPEFTKKRLIQYYENTHYEKIAETYKLMIESIVIGQTFVWVSDINVGRYFSLLGYKVNQGRGILIALDSINKIK